jgi:ribonuclease P protein component
MRRNQRLRRPEQFGRVRREGKSWAHPLLILNAGRNRTGRTRCGFVVSKQLGKAHDRNRAKRRIREAVRLVYDHIPPGWDLVFVVRTPVLAAPFDAIRRAVYDLLCRAALWVELDVAQGAVDATTTRIDPHPPLPAGITPDSA